MIPLIGNSENITMGIRLIILLNSLVLVTGCEEISFALCTANKTKEECVKEMMLEQPESKSINVGDKIYGDTKTYHLTAHRENWIQLNSGRKDNFPNRDMRLVHPTGGFIDVSVMPIGGYSAPDLTKKEISSIAATITGELEELPVDSWSEHVNDASFLRYCYNIENKGDGCFYTLALENSAQIVVITANTADYAEWVNKMEKMLLSTEIISNQQQ